MNLIKKTLIPVVIFAAAALLQAEKISFPVKSLVTIEENPIMISADWNEKWFGEKPASIYNHNIARIAGIFSAVSYEDSDIGQNSNLILHCYKALGISEKQIEFHYSVNYDNPVWGNDQAAFSFATKQINGSNSKKNLIIIVIRGTPLNANEWISNVNISDKTGNEAEYHEGFFKTTKLVENALIAFLLRNKIDIDDSCFLITGHSRGAAIANLLSAQLCDAELFDTNYIYTYTFASPNVTTNDSVYDKKYDFIWNIVNAEDIVPTVPPNYKSWEYKKYGQTKVLINNWNTDPQKYEEEYIPAMNKYFKKFMLRDYCPFTTGPFLPIQCTTILSKLNKNVYNFYNGITALHDRSISAFWRIFPKKDETKVENKTEEKPVSRTEKQGAIFAAATRWCYKNFDVDINYLINCFADMHAMETYLSWIMSVDEENVYSSVGTDILLLKGAGDYAVFDSDGKVVATILDGKVNFSKVELPLAANSLLQGQVALGLPVNRKYKIAVSKESIIPTMLKVSVQHYSAAGVFVDESEETILYPYNSKIYSCHSETLTPAFTKIDFEKIGNPEANIIRKKGNLKNISKFRVLGEFSASTSGSFNAGIHAGSTKIYGSLLLGHNAAKIGRSFEASPGIGHQSILVSKILLDTEVFANLFYAYSDDIEEKDDRFNVVPSVRFSLSFKPRHRTQLFMAANLDMHISDFNDAAFDDAYRLKTTGQVWTGSKMRIVPNLSFGIKF